VYTGAVDAKAGAGREIKGEQVIPHPLWPAMSSAEIAWQKVESESFLYYTVFGGVFMKLRLNDFPAEPVCTLILNGSEHDLEDLPRGWTLPMHRGES
jgi:hypothetical protein